MILSTTPGCPEAKPRKVIEAYPDGYGACPDPMVRLEGSDAGVFLSWRCEPVVIEKEVHGHDNRCEPPGCFHGWNCRPDCEIYKAQLERFKQAEKGLDRLVAAASEESNVAK